MLFEPRLEGVVVVARLLKPDSNSYRITDRISPGQSNCEALKARFGQRKLERCGDNFSPEVADQSRRLFFADIDCTREQALPVGILNPLHEPLLQIPPIKPMTTSCSPRTLTGSLLQISKPEWRISRYLYQS